MRGNVADPRESADAVCANRLVTSSGATRRVRENPDLYAWYAAKSVANRWSVRQLQAQIHLRLHERQGAAVSNFAEVLGPPDAQTLLEATKDPYVFDFLELAEDAQERHLEQALIDDIQNFLIELGSGFAFYGRQRALNRQDTGE